MKSLLAADGSSYTKKALGWLMANQPMDGAEDELIVVHVQAHIPPRVRAAVGTNVVREYHEEEAAKVLAPIEKFLKRHKVSYQVLWVTGVPSEEILKIAKKQKVHQIVMGTHGFTGPRRALHGSIADEVMRTAGLPVLLIRQGTAVPAGATQDAVEVASKT